MNFFNKIGNKVRRKGFGDVELIKYGAKGTAAKKHHPTKAKALAVAAVPDVIRNGIQINAKFHKGKMSYMFAAPVDFMGKKIYVAAIVHEIPSGKSNVNKYYLDEILDTDGCRFNVENIEEDVSDPKSDPPTNSGNSGPRNTSSGTTVTEAAQNVKGENPVSQGNRLRGKDFKEISRRKGALLPLEIETAFEGGFSFQKIKG